jgi:hypothetical protein
MRSLLTLSLLTYVLLGHQSTADATMLKCKVDRGSVVYQDEPCKPGMELRNFDTDPATVSVVPGSPLATTRPPAAAQRTRAAPAARRAPEQKLSSGKAAERRFIRTGMSESEVIRRIGKPEVEARGSRKQGRQGKEGKHWSYLPAAADPDTITTLTIVGGLVANVERKVVR